MPLARSLHSTGVEFIRPMPFKNKTPAAFRDTMTAAPVATSAGVSEMHPLERGARWLLRSELGLKSGQCLLVLFYPGAGIAAAERTLQHGASLHGLKVVPIACDGVSRQSTQGRSEVRAALESSDACVVLGGAGKAEARALEGMLQREFSHVPCAFLRVDPDALLNARMTPEGALVGSSSEGRHHHMNRWLVNKLRTSARMEIRDAQGTSLIVDLGDTTFSPASCQLDAQARAYPLAPVSVGVRQATGTLSAPEVFMPDGRADALFESRSFQFKQGVLRGVLGPHGVAWMREAMSHCPGLRVHSVSFGTDFGRRSEDPSRPIRVSQAGCVVTLMDQKAPAAGLEYAPYRGISFCIAGDSLDVRLDGQSVLHEGSYTAAVCTLAGARFPRHLSPRDGLR